MNAYYMATPEVNKARRRERKRRRRDEASTFKAGSDGSARSVWKLYDGVRLRLFSVYSIVNGGDFRRDFLRMRTMFFAASRHACSRPVTKVDLELVVETMFFHLLAS